MYACQLYKFEREPGTPYIAATGSAYNRNDPHTGLDKTYFCNVHGWHGTGANRGKA